jgi:hypothetical protein
MHMIIYSLFWDDESFVYKQPQYVYMFIYICIYLKMYIYMCVCMYIWSAFNMAAKPSAFVLAPTD